MDPDSRRFTRLQYLFCKLFIFFETLKATNIMAHGKSSELPNKMVYFCQSSLFSFFLIVWIRFLKVADPVWIRVHNTGVLTVLLQGGAGLLDLLVWSGLVLVGARHPTSRPHGAGIFSRFIYPFVFWLGV